MTEITKDTNEMNYFYQIISIIIQKGNAISFLHTFNNDNEMCNRRLVNDDERDINNNNNNNNNGCF